MEHVFLLLVYLGDPRTLVSGDMHFEDINRCNYFASQIAKRYGNYHYSDYIPPQDRVTAYCVPRFVAIGSVEVYRNAG
jgi:hypothetical protein